MNRLLDIIKGSELLVYNDDMLNSIALKYGIQSVKKAEANISKEDYSSLELKPTLLKNLHINYSFLFRKIEHTVSFLSTTNKGKFINQVKQRILYSNSYLEEINEANHFFFLKRIMLEKNKVLHFDISNLLSQVKVDKKSVEFTTDEKIEKTNVYRFAYMIATGLVKYDKYDFYFENEKYTANALGKKIGINKAYLSDTIRSIDRYNNKDIFSLNKNRTLDYLVNKLNAQNIKISDFFLDRYNAL